MLISSLAFLLALAPSPALTREGPTELLVKVVDGSGKPCGDVPVLVTMRVDLPEDVERPEVPLLTARTDRESGIARFADLSNVPAPNEHMRPIVRLCVPALDRVEEEFDPAKLPSVGITLVAPDLGSVLLRTPATRGGTIQIRRARQGESALGSMWYGRALPSVEIVDGAGRFEHVGLGIELEYRVRGEGLPAELRGTFAGPTRAGQVVEFDVPAQKVHAELVARLLDSELRPVGDTLVNWSVSIEQEGSSSSRGGLVRSDADGRVRMTLAEDQARSGSRTLLISAWSDAAAVERIGDGFVLLVIPEEFTSGSLDLGELIVAPYGSPARFVRMDDDALKRAFAAPRITLRGGRESASPHEEALVEMVRRGGAVWSEYVEMRMAAERAQATPFRGSAAGELEMLTALRRLQRKPDPLAVLLAPDAVLDVVSPDTPQVRFEVKNVDSGGLSFEVAQGGSYRSGRFARCSVEAIRADGTRLPPRAWGAGFGGGMYSTPRLEPGKSIGYAIVLGDYVELSMPGVYRVRIHYHDKEDIDYVHDLEGWIVSSSSEFFVRVLPRTIALAKTRHDEIRGWIRAIDATKPVMLVRSHWNEGLSFEGEAVTPEDKVFRAGWIAVPALFEAIEDPALERERRAWALGMLWNILGLDDPATAQTVTALGRVEWMPKWPTSSGEATPRFGGTGTFSPVPIDPAAQDTLVERWRVRKGMFEVKLLP